MLYETKFVSDIPTLMNAATVDRLDEVKSSRIDQTGRKLELAVLYDIELHNEDDPSVSNLKFGLELTWNSAMMNH